MKLHYVFLVTLYFVTCGNSNPDRFGMEIKPVCNDANCYKTLDFNGDNQIDTLFILDYKKQSEIRKECNIVKIGYSEEPFKNINQLLLGIVLASSAQNGKKLFVLYNQGLFSTPIWEKPYNVVNVIKSNDVPQEVRTLRMNEAADIVALGTEAGIDIYLYWDGKKFTVFEPDEEP